MQNESKLSDEIEKKLDLLMEKGGIKSYIDKKGIKKWDDGEYDYTEIVTDLQDFIATTQADVAQQCYLECLAVECGEGECARAIRTKFDLKGI